MTKEGIISEIFFYTEDKIYEANIGIRASPHSDISWGRSWHCGEWWIYRYAQAFKNVEKLKLQLILWKERYGEECENLPNVAWERFHGNIIEYRNADAELKGKVHACEDLLEFISKVENI